MNYFFFWQRSAILCETNKNHVLSNHQFVHPIRRQQVLYLNRNARVGPIDYRLINSSNKYGQPKSEQKMPTRHLSPALGSNAPQQSLPLLAIDKLRKNIQNESQPTIESLSLLTNAFSFPHTFLTMHANQKFFSYFKYLLDEFGLDKEKSLIRR